MAAPQNKKTNGTINDRLPPKAMEGNNLRPVPIPTVKLTTVTKDELLSVDGCPTCDVTFDTANAGEIVRAMVIGEALNTPRFKYPYGKRR